MPCCSSNGTPRRHLAAPRAGGAGRQYVPGRPARCQRVTVSRAGRLQGPADGLEPGAGRVCQAGLADRHWTHFLPGAWRTWKTSSVDKTNLRPAASVRAGRSGEVGGVPDGPFTATRSVAAATINGISVGWSALQVPPPPTFPDPDCLQAGRCGGMGHS